MPTPPPFDSRLLSSEQDLQPELNHARALPSLGNYAKRAARWREGTKVAIWVGELCMIPGIVELGTKFGIEPLVDRRPFFDSQVRIADSRAATQRVRQIAKHTRCGRIGNVG